MVTVSPAASPTALPRRRLPTRPRRAARLQRRRFGRRRAFPARMPMPTPATRLSDDLRLFASTFAAGFLFVAVLIG